MKLFGALMLVLGLAAGGLAFAADAATKPALPACCGDKCKAMGDGCCKTGADGKVTCDMGGSCCIKPGTAPAGSMPAMPGMGGM